MESFNSNIDKAESEAKVWQPARRNIPFLLNLFKETPIDIRKIISLMDGSKLWPKVSDMTGVSNSLIYEMVDAQYPMLPPLRPVRKNKSARRTPAPPQETAYSMLFNPRFDVSAIPRSLILNSRFKQKFTAKISAVPTDDSNDKNTPYEYVVKNNANAKYLRKLLVQATKYFYENEVLSDMHDSRPTVHAESMTDDKLKDFYNEYDVADADNLERQSSTKTIKSAWSRLSVDRVSPAVYCILYGNLLYMTDEKNPGNKRNPCFRIEDDTYEESELLRMRNFQEYANINLPKIAHWEQTRKTHDINDHIMCRLLRVSKQTLTRWEHGYRAPLSIRIFFDLFSKYTLELMNLLIRIQDEIIENFLIKLRDIFTYLTIEYPSAQSSSSACAGPANTDSPPRCVSIDAPNLPPPDAWGRCQIKWCPSCCPNGAQASQPKLRRYKGAVVRAALVPPEQQGAYHLVGPVIAPKSGKCTYQQFVLGQKNPFAFAKEYPDMDINELNQLAAIHELVLPSIVRRK